MDTLSSLLEVKLDIREKRSDWLPTRSWARCYVKIEAVRCFPCYIKITFHKSATDSSNPVTQRINIPGLEVYPVKSRTKLYAYGLYWKQNRKNCIAFLSLDSQLNMEAHMRWVDSQIQTLETYRKEILQSSRFSRATMEQSLILQTAEDSGVYQNMNETDKVRDVNDILGPLPQIPNGCMDYDRNSMRRMSAFSGIYEEIVEPSNRSRNARGSAIYEEMKLNRPEPTSSPPPLPPRVRKNTDCSTLQRSYTTPESELAKKKWSLFENVFGKSRKGEAKRRERNAQPQPRELQLLKAKRNSFSSPDLSHLDASFNKSECPNCSFELENPSNISSSNSYELDAIICEEDEVDANVSQQIKPNFELELMNDISSVNLVGSNYNLNQTEKSSPQSQPSTSPPGYLEMRPGKGFDMKKVEELDNETMKNDVLYRLTYSFDSPITYKREFDYERLPPNGEGFYTNDRLAEPHYVCMTKGTSKKPLAEPVYTPMIRAPAVIVDQYASPIMSHSTKTSLRNSVDDKIASYFPNYDVPVKSNGQLRKSPPRTQTTEPTINFDSPLRKGGKRVGSFSGFIPNDNNNNSENDVNKRSTEASKKYATISRLTVKTDENQMPSPTVIKKSGSISPTSIKRFATLKGIKKFDFSPLRMKISSVLQRNNAGGN